MEPALAADPIATESASAADPTSAIARFERTLRGRPLATNSFSAGAYAQSKATALAMREIAPDPEGWIRAIRHDVDREDALEHVAALVEGGTLPEPSWIIVRPANGHAHVIWDLGRWVRRDRPRQLALFERVREALRQRVGGDRAYVGKFQHNPMHPDFERWGAGRLWELGALVDAIGADVWKSQPARAKVDAVAAALGRNCSNFENGRVAAYAIVEQFRRRGDEAGFARRVEELIQSENEMHAVRLGDKECRQIARSISRWTWAVYRRGNGAAAAHRTASEQSRAEYLAAADAARTEARKLRAEGLGATEIARRMKRSRSWVYVALAEALLTVQSPPAIRVCAFPVPGARCESVSDFGDPKPPRASFGSSTVTGIPYALQRCRELAAAETLRRPDPAREPDTGSPIGDLLDYAGTVIGFAVERPTRRTGHDPNPNQEMAFAR